jgi:hypothetical protein
MERVIFKKVLKNDSYTVSLMLTSVIFVIMLVIFLAMPDQVSSLGLYMILGFDVAAIILLGVRLFLLMTFKPDGKVYKATVVKAYTYRSSKHIKFTYRVDGVDYTKKNVLFSSKFSRALMKGDEIDIYISQSNPARALIRDAYFETEVL